MDFESIFLIDFTFKYRKFDGIHVIIIFLLKIIINFFSNEIKYLCSLFFFKYPKYQKKY